MCFVEILSCSCYCAGYLLLLIYSAANLCDRSWGTREQSSGEDEGLWGWRVYFIRAWRKLTSLWCCVKCCWRGGGGGGEREAPPSPERLEVVVSEEQEGRQVGGEEGDGSAVDMTDGEETFTESREYNSSVIFFTLYKYAFMQL